MTTTERTGHRIGLSRPVQVSVIAATTALGAVLGLIVRGLVSWLERTVDGSPGPLRIAAQLPVGVAVGVLAVAGLIGGVLLAGIWQHEVVSLTVADDHVELEASGHRRWIGSAEIGEAFLGRGGELTVLDRRGRLLAAASTDGVSGRRIAAAFADAGYRWSGERDPYEADYLRFVDGRDDAEPAVCALLRERAVARAEKREPTAHDLRLRLGDHGVVVRDRGDEQEFRRARHNG